MFYESFSLFHLASLGEIREQVKRVESGETLSDNEIKEIIIGLKNSKNHDIRPAELMSGTVRLLEWDLLFLMLNLLFLNVITFSVLVNSFCGQPGKEWDILYGVAW